MIKAIIFDCFGVLTTDTWKEFVSTLEPGHVAQASALNHDYDRGEITKTEFLQTVEKLTGKQPVYIDDDISDAHTINKNLLLLDYISQLKKSYKVGILSNVATNWINDYFLTPKERNLFDAMIFSFEVGITKPEASIFRLACQKLGVEPKEAIMVDDIERYCQAAKATGMQAICYHDFRQFKTELEQILSHR